MVKVQSRRPYICLMIALGLLISPVYCHAAETPVIPATVEQDNGPMEQAVSTEAQNAPSCIQKLTLKLKPVFTPLAGLAAAAGTAYLHDRTVTMGHEGSHVFTAMLGGYGGDLYVSPKFWGGAWSSHNCPAGTPMAGLIALAGPFGGITTYLAWLQVWNMAIRYWKSGNVKESIAEGKKDPLFNKDSSLLAIGGTFYGIYQHYIHNLIPIRFVRDASFGPLAGTATVNDAVQVQEALANIAPFLAKAYPFLAYAGLASLMGYGTYGLYATYKAKKQAGQWLW